MALLTEEPRNRSTAYRTSRLTNISAVSRVCREGERMPGPHLQHPDRFFTRESHLHRSGPDPPSTLTPREPTSAPSSRRSPAVMEYIPPNTPASLPPSYTTVQEERPPSYESLFPKKDAAVDMPPV